MKCSQAQEYLLDSLLGEELPGEAGDQLRRHLSSCPRCRQEAEEFNRAWERLDRLQEVRFSRRLDAAVLRRLKPPPRPLLIYLRPALAAALVILTVAFLLRVFRPSEEGMIREDRTASLLKPGSPRLPDQEKTLKNYLRRSENVLVKLERGEYKNWRKLFDAILTPDLQGKANYLLENLPAGSPARAVVKDVSDNFWRLLQRGRGREEESILLPADLDPARLRQEIASLNSQ